MLNGLGQVAGGVDEGPELAGACRGQKMISVGPRVAISQGPSRSGLVEPSSFVARLVPHETSSLPCAGKEAPDRRMWPVLASQSIYRAVRG